MATKAQICANRPNAQESDSPESENVRKITYEFISKNMQNEPNFRKSQMNVNKVLTKDYENKTLGQRGKNEPNTNPIRTQTNPIKANSQNDQMNVSVIITKDYEKMSNWALYENEPKTNPIKANSKPIKANKMPKQTQYKPKQSQTKPISEAKKCCSPPFCCGISKEKIIFCNLINRKSQFERI